MMNTKMNSAAEHRMCSIKRLSDGHIIVPRYIVQVDTVRPFISQSDGFISSCKLDFEYIPQTEDTLLLTDLDYLQSTGAERFVVFKLPYNAESRQHRSLYYDRLYMDMFVITSLCDLADTGKIYGTESNEQLGKYMTTRGIAIGGAWRNTHGGNMVKKSSQGIFYSKLDLKDESASITGAFIGIDGVGTKSNTGRISYVNSSNQNSGYVQFTQEVASLYTLPPLNVMFNNPNDINVMTIVKNDDMFSNIYNIYGFDVTKPVSFVLPE